MTTLREAAQRALEAWQTATYGHPSHHKATLLAMTALRAALAEPKEKPWRCACGANLYIDEHGAPRSKA